MQTRPFAFLAIMCFGRMLLLTWTIDAGAKDLDKASADSVVIGSLAFPGDRAGTGASDKMEKEQIDKLTDIRKGIHLQAAVRIDAQTEEEYPLSIHNTNTYYFDIGKDRSRSQISIKWEDGREPIFGRYVLFPPRIGPSKANPLKDIQVRRWSILYKALCGDRTSDGVIYQILRDDWVEARKLTEALGDLLDFHLNRDKPTEGILPARDLGDQFLVWFDFELSFAELSRVKHVQENRTQGQMDTQLSARAWTQREWLSRALNYIAELPEGESAHIKRTLASVDRLSAFASHNYLAKEGSTFEDFGPEGTIKSTGEKWVKEFPVRNKDAQLSGDRAFATDLRQMFDLLVASAATRQSYQKVIRDDDLTRKWKSQQTPGDKVSFNDYLEAVKIVDEFLDAYAKSSDENFRDDKIHAIPLRAFSRFADFLRIVNRVLYVKQPPAEKPFGTLPTAIDPKWKRKLVIVGVSTDDILSMREYPRKKGSLEIDQLDPSLKTLEGTGLVVPRNEVGECWIQVKDGKLTGWVNEAFVKPAP